MIPYARHEVTHSDIQALTQVLQSDFLTQGPAITAFEEAFAKYIGSPYAVAVANGTAALHLAAIALGVNPRTRVITSPITFVASANCIRYCEGEVDFCDVDPHTGLMDLDLLEAKLQAAPKGTYQGVIPVDLAGYPVDLVRLHQLANQYGLWILEDACHAPGGKLHSPDQSYGCGDAQLTEAAIFSLHPAKHIASGEGGVITTSSKEIYEKLCQLRTHGITKDPSKMSQNDGGWYYQMQELGYNYRLPDILAALGHSQLLRAEENLHKRRERAKRYDQALKGTSIHSIVPASHVEHAYHLYIVLHEHRQALYDFLKSNQIFAQVHYIPVHLQPYYASLGWKSGDFPQAEAFYQRCLSLPMYPSLSLSEQDFVIEKLLEFDQLHA